MKFSCPKELAIFKGQELQPTMVLNAVYLSCGFPSHLTCKGVWSLSRASHGNGGLKSYNVNIDCDVTFNG
jgi:hypothetical protein